MCCWLCSACSVLGSDPNVISSFVPCRPHNRLHVLAGQLLGSAGGSVPSLFQAARRYDWSEERGLCPGERTGATQHRVQASVISVNCARLKYTRICQYTRICRYMVAAIGQMCAWFWLKCQKTQLTVHDELCIRLPAAGH